MSSHHHYYFLNTTCIAIITPLLFLLLLLLLHFSAVSSFDNPPITNFRQSLLFEEKTRLGSTPPSCHNKCNGCHPCMAVQVPTTPSHNRVKPGNLAKKPEFFDTYPAGNRYSNYKPLGWKCRCRGHFYNP